MEKINLLTALDKNYLPQLNVLMTSADLNNPGMQFDLYLLHSGLSEAEIESVRRSAERAGNGFFPVKVDEKLFDGAPVSRQYPKEMYYRLLAGKMFPREINRVLYLDPDILIINPLLPLWKLDMKGELFAAAAHTGKTELANSVNRLRLGVNHDYYNSGVLLMNLEEIRKAVIPEEIFSYVEKHGKELILPDQDLLNALYGDEIIPVPDELWNYDARNYNNYLLRSGGAYNLPWVMEHTAILHFCGKAKPWKTYYTNRFGMLYRHYMQIAERKAADKI